VSLAWVLEFVRMKISVTLLIHLMFQEIVTQARHLEVVNKDLEQSNHALPGIRSMSLPRLAGTAPEKS